MKGGATYWGDLSLESNAASFNGDEIKDYNDANRTDSSKPHTTRGTAEYILTTPQAGTATTASFKMEYAPFGLGDTMAWAGDKPVWVIRNGLNDAAQNAQTDFAEYNGITGTGKNANGAISVAMVDPAAPLVPGLYEGGNPAPVEGVDASGADGLANALTALDDNGAKAKYGEYTIVLDTAPDSLAPITLGGGGYPDIKDITLVIDGPVGAPIKLSPADELFPPQTGSGVTVEYGDGVTVGYPVVTFDSNGGDTEADPATATATGHTFTVSLPETPPTLADYIFDSWNDDKDGNGATFTAATPVYKDITVWAQWMLIPGPFTVTFDANGGSVSPASATATVIYPATTVGSLPVPTRAGYDFAGWNTAQDGGGDIFTASTTVNASIPVYAQWVSIVYDYTDASNSNWDELANYIAARQRVTAYQGSANSAATPVSIKIINAGTVTAPAMVAVNTHVSSAGFYVALDLSDTSNNFASNTVTKDVMSDNIAANTWIKGVALPEGVSAIGAKAFQQCKLAGITLPAGLASIDISAFRECHSLTSITLPASLTTIGESVFFGCENLASADLSQCTNLSSTGMHTFNWCTGLSSVTLPANLATIDVCAFENCTSLTSIDLPASLTAIADYAFASSGLNSVTFNSNGIAISSEYPPFVGDLRTKYLDGSTGGSGTYTRQDNTWTKQQP